jgi:hypothetical protein
MNATEILIVTGLIAGVAVHAAMSLFILLRPKRVVSFIAMLPFVTRPEMAVIMRPVATLPPYRWLYEGQSYDEIMERLSLDPGAFPRLVLAIRILGGMSLAVNLLIVAVVALMAALA